MGSELCFISDPYPESPGGVLEIVSCSAEISDCNRTHTVNIIMLTHSAIFGVKMGLLITKPTVSTLPSSSMSCATDVSSVRIMSRNETDMYVRIII